MHITDFFSIALSVIKNKWVAQLCFKFLLIQKNNLFRYSKSQFNANNEFFDPLHKLQHSAQAPCLQQEYATQNRSTLAISSRHSGGLS